MFAIWRLYCTQSTKYNMLLISTSKHTKHCWVTQGLTQLDTECMASYDNTIARIYNCKAFAIMKCDHPSYGCDICVQKKAPTSNETLLTLAQANWHCKTLSRSLLSDFHNARTDVSINSQFTRRSSNRWALYIDCIHVKMTIYRNESYNIGLKKEREEA